MSIFDNPALKQFINKDNTDRLLEYLNSLGISLEDFKNSIKVYFKDPNTIFAKSSLINIELGGLHYKIIDNDNYINNTIFGDDVDLRNRISFKPYLCTIIMVETKNLFQRIGLANRMFKLLIDKYEKDCHFCLEIDPFGLTTHNVIDRFYKNLGFIDYDFYISADYRWRI
jgi:hypothetical protein